MMKTKHFKSILSILAVILMMTLSGCHKSPYDKALNLINELSEEVTRANDNVKYDAVYNKIVGLQTNPIITNLKDLTLSQKIEVKVKMTNLVQQSLAVKAIQFEMPPSVKPTPEDIKALCKKCIDDKVPVVGAFGYPEVKAVINEYYKLDN